MNRTNELAIHLRHRSSNRVERRFSPMSTLVEQAILIAQAPLTTVHSGQQ